MKAKRSKCSLDFSLGLFSQALACESRMEFDLKRQVGQLSLNSQAKACENKPRLKSRLHFERFSFNYCPYAITVGRGLADSSCLSLEDYIKKNVFTPLEMNHSTFIWVNDNRKASGHNPDGSPIENRSTEPPNAAFTLHTSALDYARFITAIFKGIGLKSETINEMFRFQVKVPEGSASSIDKCSGRFSDSISWGLGWGLQRTKIGDSFWHWGDNEGVKSFIVGFNHRNTAMIIFTNSSNGLSLISEIIQKYLDFPQPAFDWLDAAYSSNNQKR